MAAPPLISIGITCFNAQDTIASAIEGALQQDWKNFEIIVVDDASTDGSVEIIAEIAEKDSRVQPIRHAINSGYPASLNNIVRKAKGEFIAIFDDDDISAPVRLRKQFERIIAYEQAHDSRLTLCYSNRAILLPGATEPSDIAYAIGRRSPEPAGSIVADHILWKYGDNEHIWGMFGSCTLMARRNVFEKIGPFDENFRRCAEWDFAIRAALAGAHFIAVDESLVTQRKTLTADKAGKISQDYQIKLCKKYRDYLKRKGVYFAALMMARSGKKHNVWRYRLMTVIACLLSPHRILINKINKMKGMPGTPKCVKLCRN